MNSRDIIERLAEADREHQKEAAGGLLLQSIKYFCAVLLALFALDVVFHLSSAWRFGLMLLTGLAVVSVFIAAWYVGWRRRNRPEHIARFLEGRDPGLGSRLINLLQLREQCRDTDLAPLTRDLAKQAVDGYAAELKGTPLNRLAQTGELRREAKHAGAAFTGFALMLVLFFRVSAVEVARFVDPFGDHPPYSFTRLEIVSPDEAGTNVIYGKAFVVRVKSAGHRPKDVFLSYHPPGKPEAVRTVPMFEKTGEQYDQLIEPIHDELVLVAHTKDRASLSKQRRICVILTPKLERAFVQVTPPAYTRQEPFEKAYQFANLQALVGSELRFRLQSNRPLREGLIEFGSEQMPERVALRPGMVSANGRTNQTEVVGTMVARESGRLRFSLTDIDRLPSQDTWEGALTVTHDLPPEIQISNPERDAFVAADFKLEVKIDSRDDYGIQTVRLHIGSNGIYASPLLLTNAAAPREQQDVVPLHIEAMSFKPGDVVSLYAEALDTCPDAHLARSQTVRLQLISVEDYNNFLREQTDLAELAQKYEDLMAHLDEMIGQQRKLSKAAEQLKEQIAKTPEKEREKLAMELDQLLAKQHELNTRLNQHAETMEQFVRKEPLYDVEKDFQEVLSRLAERIRDSTRTNTASGENIAQRSTGASKRNVSPELAQDFESASDRQVAQLEGVQEKTQGQIAQTMQDMSRLQELLKDFNQIEALYNAQKELAQQAQVYNRQGSLSREDQLALKELAAVEERIGKRLDEVAERLLEDARAAEELFPKAAQSGRDLAEKMSELRLSPLARQATSQMLAGKGDRSFRMADRLREEMEKLFSECQQCRGEGEGELDAYLRLVRSMNSGRNFAQMARSRLFGSGNSPGIGLGIGEGPSGSSGFAMMDSPPMNLMGNERVPNQGSATSRDAARQGRGKATASGLAQAELDRPDLLRNLNPVNRQSAAVSSETGLDEYSELVDTYFEAITSRREK